MCSLLRARMLSCLVFMIGKFSMEDEKQMSGEENINLSGQDPGGQNPSGQNPANESNYFDSVEHYNVHGDPSLYGDDYFNKFPPGYRFKPYDEELVVHYLTMKLKNRTLPPNRIKEVELYKHNPEDLAGKHIANGEKEWYFFTPRDRKYKNGARPNRAAGKGYWKATGADKPVKSRGVVVGFKKSLVFYNGKAPKGEKTQWIMHEFRVKNQPKKQRGVGQEMRLDEWVLCRLYKKVDKKVDKSRSKDNAVPNQEPENGIQPPFQYMSVEDSKMLPQENFMPEGLESFDHLGVDYNPANQMSLHSFDNTLYFHGLQGSFPGVLQSFYPQLGQNSMVQHMIPDYQNSTLLIGEKLTPTESNIKHEQFKYYHSDELLNIPPEVNCFDQMVYNFTGASSAIYPPSFNDVNGARNSGIIPAHNGDKKRKNQKKHQ